MGLENMYNRMAAKATHQLTGARTPDRVTGGSLHEEGAEMVVLEMSGQNNQHSIDIPGSIPSVGCFGLPMFQFKSSQVSAAWAEPRAKPPTALLSLPVGQPVSRGRPELSSGTTFGGHCYCSALRACG